MKTSVRQHLLYNRLENLIHDSSWQRISQHEPFTAPIENFEYYQNFHHVLSEFLIWNRANDTTVDDAYGVIVRPLLNLKTFSRIYNYYDISNYSQSRIEIVINFNHIQLNVQQLWQTNRFKEFYEQALQYEQNLLIMELTNHK